MSRGFILFIALWSLYSCQSLGLFAPKFLQEISKIRPILDFIDAPFIPLRPYLDSYKVEKKRTVKSVDLNNVFNNCNLDFEINLVQSPTLPASDHQVAHINIGGLLIPGQKPNFTNKWVCTVGVVIKNNSQFNSVYSLMYNLSVDLKKSTLEEESGLDLSGVDERDLAKIVFYNELLKIYNVEILPIKS